MTYDNECVEKSFPSSIRSHMKSQCGPNIRFLPFNGMHKPTLTQTRNTQTHTPTPLHRTRYVGTSTNQNTMAVQCSMLHCYMENGAFPLTEWILVVFFLVRSFARSFSFSDVPFRINLLIMQLVTKLIPNFLVNRLRIRQGQFCVALTGPWQHRW